jgi:hypothetical protein
MFRTLTISLVLLMVTGTSRMEGKAIQENEGSRHQLRVKIYDYAQVPPEILAEAKKVAGSIFRKIGVEILWLDYSFKGSSGGGIFNTESTYPQLQLRILNQRMAERLPVNKHMTGLTLQGTGGQVGRVANIFYHRVEELARSKTCSKGEILAHAVAHEIGHLLLGNVDHSPAGLMKAQLGHKELQSAARGDLVFLESEAEQIRKALAEPLLEP